MKNVADKVAFVTGGGSGIGLGIAQVLLRNGVRVVIADLQSDHLDEARQVLREHGERAHFVAVDVADRAAMAAAADDTERTFGSVDILCNNAGVTTLTPIEDATYADWDWVLKPNINGTINGVVTFLPRMRSRGQGGHIVNTSSMAGLIPLPGPFGIYCVSKFAIRALSESLRQSLARENIGVTLLIPGVVQTRLPISEQRLRPDFASSREASGNRPDVSAGMDALSCGKLVLKGIVEDMGYVFTHSEDKSIVERAFQIVLDSFPDNGPPDLRILAYGRRMGELISAYRPADHG